MKKSTIVLILVFVLIVLGICGLVVYNDPFAMSDSEIQAYKEQARVDELERTQRLADAKTNQLNGWLVDASIGIQTATIPFVTDGYNAGPWYSNEMYYVELSDADVLIDMFIAEHDVHILGSELVWERLSSSNAQTSAIRITFEPERQ